MSDVTVGQASTPRTNNLPVGYRLHEYEILQTLGAGGFGITYLARDTNLEKLVAIKEFFPFSFAARYEDSSIGPLTDAAGQGVDYAHLLSRFIDEARTLAKFEHANVLRVLRYFEANNTAYIIMEYVEGPTLSKLVKERQSLDEAQLRPILLALIDGLRAVHAHDMLHRDIKPDNIVLRGGRSPVLIDFGASREAMGRRGHSVTMMWTPGYAPIEQMSEEGELGPHSDIYALGATAYMVLVGSPPGDAASRILNDRTTPAVVAASGRASVAFLEAIDWAIRPFAKDRPQNVDAWLAAFNTNTGRHDVAADERTVVIRPKVVSPASAVSAVAPAPIPAATDGVTHRRGGGLVVAVLVVAALLAAIGAYLTFGLGGDDRASASPVSELPVETSPAMVIEPAADPVQSSVESVATGVDDATTPVVEAASAAEADSARDPQDDEDFRIATLVDSPEAYQLYLRLHPQGAHVERARELTQMP